MKKGIQIEFVDGHIVNFGRDFVRCSCWLNKNFNFTCGHIRRVASMKLRGEI